MTIPLVDDAPLVEWPPQRTVKGILLAVANLMAKETSLALAGLTTTA